MTGLGPECVSSRVALLLRLAEHIWVLSICIFLYISFIDMGSKVWSGGFCPLSAAACQPGYCLFWRSRSHGTGSNLKPSRLAVCFVRMVFAKFFIVFWMGESVRAHSCGNRQNVVCAGISASLFLTCVCVCFCVLHYYCGGVGECIDLMLPARTHASR
jgi:hypothetical protein